MKGERKIYRVLCCLLMAVGLPVIATMRADEHPHLLSDEAKIYLVTCGPGEELYERYGHTAILVRDNELGIDEVYNYGIFDFSAEHFYWRFVKGETYYQLGKEDTPWFLRLYAFTERDVNIQLLNLTAEQRDAIYRALIINYYPENRVYLYNFVFDNCATRPYYLLKEALSQQSGISNLQSADTLPAISSSYTGAEGITYREFIRRYTPKGSWGDFGINLVFGPKADQAMQGEQRLFLPEELMNYIEAAQFADGSPVVAESHIQPFTIRPVPWYKTWYFGMVVLFLALAEISYYDRKRGQRSRWVDYILFVFYFLLLILVTFLTFFSIHPLVGFGPYLLIIPTIHLCARLIYYIRR